jgi:hypothetical protein
MLRVPTRIGPSELSGLGLFAEVKIDRGQTVWIFDPGFDQKYHRDQVDVLLPFLRDELWRYCYTNSWEPGMLVICLDGARFLNFGDPTNLQQSYEHTVEGELALVAARDIEKGEELTVPYESDADAARKLSKG